MSRVYNHEGRLCGLYTPCKARGWGQGRNSTDDRNGDSALCHMVNDPRNVDTFCPETSIFPRIAQRAAHATEMALDLR